MSGRPSALSAICVEYLSSGAESSDGEEENVNAGKCIPGIVNVQIKNEPCDLMNPCCSKDIGTNNGSMDITIKSEPPWDFSDLRSMDDTCGQERLPNPLASNRFGNNDDDVSIVGFVGTAYKSHRIKEEAISSGTEDSEVSSDPESDSCSDYERDDSGAESG